MSSFISCYRQTVQVKNPISTPALASSDLIYNLRFSRELVGDKWSYCRAGKWVILPSQMLHSQQIPCVKWYTVLYMCSCYRQQATLCSLVDRRDDILYCSLLTAGSAHQLHPSHRFVHRLLALSKSILRS